MNDFWVPPDKHVIIFDQDEERSQRLITNLQLKNVPSIAFVNRKDIIDHVRLNSWRGRHMCLLVVQTGIEGQRFLNSWFLSAYRCPAEIIMFENANEYIAQEITPTVTSNMPQFIDLIKNIFDSLEFIVL